MKINIKKVSENAIIPTYESAEAASADIYACINSKIVIAHKIQ